MASWIKKSDKAAGKKSRRLSTLAYVRKEKDDFAANAASSAKQKHSSKLYRKD